MVRTRASTILSWGAAQGIDSVTVAVSLYNYANHIEECLESIAGQDFLSLELIVVDDFSQKDKSIEVATNWIRKNMKRFIRGVFIKHDINYGLAEARNTAFKASASDLVMVMDADNALFPSAVRKLRRSLLAVSGDAAYSQLVMFGDAAGEIGYADYWAKDQLAKGPYIDAMALVRKSAWQRVGGYTHLDGGWEDYDFWCKLAEADALVCYVPELLCRYRVHKTSMLRLDAVKNYDRLYNLISLRHPWTKLDPISR